jgi:hypothetical protein
MDGDLEVRLDSVMVAEGDSITPGDTLALALDTLSLLEAQRMRMEADFLRQAPQTDSARLDSLLSMASKLETPTPIPAGGSGILDELLVEAGRTVAPGDTLAMLVDEGPNLQVELPEGLHLERWPVLEGSAPLESTDTTAVYSVLPSGGDSLRLDGLWCVPRTALRDQGLRSFVLLAGGDTVVVERMGSCGGDVVVAGPLDGVEMITW